MTLAEEPKKKLTAAEVERMVDRLRGVPAGAPSLEEAKALQAAGWALVVAYCRISDDAHKRDGHGVEDQTRHCGRIAERGRMVVVHHYIDNDKSASKADVVRADFDNMISALERGSTDHGYPVDGVVCVADDRLYRGAHAYERFVDSFTGRPDRVYADETGRHDLYGDGAEYRGLLGVAASRSETKKKKRRARLNHLARAERGEPVSGRRPFGWNEDKLTLHPGESAVVRQGVLDLLAGKSITTVTWNFIESGFSTTLGNSWQLQTVKQILRNPRICGYRKLKGELVSDAQGQPVVGKWEAIVTPKEWYAVTALLEKQRSAAGWNGSGDSPRTPRKYLLTGLLRCGKKLEDGRTCNTKMHGAPARETHKYRCRSVLDGGCDKLSRQGPAIDKLITQLVLAKLEMRNAERKPVEDSWDGEPTLEAAQRRKSALEDRWHAEEISDSSFFSLLKKEEAEIKRLSIERKAWDARQETRRHGIKDVRAQWENGEMDLQQKRAVIFDALEAVIVLPGVKGSHKFDPNTIIPVWKEEEAL
ncbi:recombinase family protein [Streptomyces sp. AM8-1-1]|uniref:recombinase family protein n=1 Tax=Streptomyces sp. AM8-1-1 TaxID=3075825 RepID=UPI0028C4C916|nr:recombinase family protein [Streptomyces sp. AM8-1-1]WNO73075.1 recombinase family protein [Streptomyces sp. AM8-1-1]